jgi:hypothetical protein
MARKLKSNIYIFLFNLRAIFSLYVLLAKALFFPAYFLGCLLFPNILECAEQHGIATRYSQKQQYHSAFIILVAFL